MNYTFLHYFFIAFLLTNLIEFFPLVLLIKKPVKEKVFALVLINAITLPIVWIVTQMFYTNYLVVTILLEIFVIIAETGLIKIALNQKLKDSLKAAFIMNFLSASIGSVVLSFML